MIQNPEKNQEDIMDTIAKIRKSANSSAWIKAIFSITSSSIIMYTLMSLYSSGFFSEDILIKGTGNQQDTIEYVARTTSYITAARENILLGKSLINNNSISRMVTYSENKNGQEGFSPFFLNEVIERSIKGLLKISANSRSNQTPSFYGKLQCGINVGNSWSNDGGIIITSILATIARFDDKGIMSCEQFDIITIEMPPKYDSADANNMKAYLEENQESLNKLAHLALTYSVSQKNEIQRFVDNEQKILKSIEDEFTSMQIRVSITDTQRIVSVLTKAILTITLVGLLMKLISIMSREFRELSRNDRIEIITALLKNNIIHLKLDQVNSLKILLDSSDIHNDKTTDISENSSNLFEGITSILKNNFSHRIAPHKNRDDPR